MKRAEMGLPSNHVFGLIDGRWESVAITDSASKKELAMIAGNNPKCTRFMANGKEYGRDELC